MREMAPLARAVGKGQLFCAHHGWHVHLMRLAGGALCLSADELLAFEDTLDYEMFLVGNWVGAAAGGLLAVRLSGSGALAMAVHGDPLALRVTPEEPLCTDPHATLAWAGNLEPELKTDLTWRSLFRHGGGEPVQMLFRGDGHVVVQPSEDPARLQLKPGKQLKKLIL